MNTTPKYSRLEPGQRRAQILDAANELLASTLEHVLRTFGTPPAPSRRTSPP
jgi:hypothetical protein